MDVGLDIFRNINLYHPVHLGEVQPSGSNICAEQNPVLFLAEGIEDGHPLLLLLSPLQLIDWASEFEGPHALINEPHLFASRQED